MSMSDAPRIRVGPAESPARDSPEKAVKLLVSRGYTACELDFEGGFWLEKADAERLGELAAAKDIALSVHAPLPAFLGHLERDQKYQRAMGMLDHSANLARLTGAQLVVIHPGFLLGRPRDEALRSVAEQLGELGARLKEKRRLVPFGIEVMGRARDLGGAEDVFWLARQLDWVRPVLDFAHLHAITDGGLTDVIAFAEFLDQADAVLPAEAPFHIHFSDIAFANRNERRHLSYGQGTLRAEPLREALALYARPATVISESPDEESHQALRAILLADAKAGHGRPGRSGPKPAAREPAGAGRTGAAGRPKAASRTSSGG
jgi:deoxyribonuclease-4